MNGIAVVSVIEGIVVSNDEAIPDASDTIITGNRNPRRRILKFLATRINLVLTSCDSCGFINIIRVDSLLIADCQLLMAELKIDLQKGQLQSAASRQQATSSVA